MKYTRQVVHYVRLHKNLYIYKLDFPCTDMHFFFLIVLPSSLCYSDVFPCNFSVGTCHIRKAIEMIIG